MLLTVSTSTCPATDLGYLLFKHPDRAQVFSVASGVAHVFYPRADEAVCTAALLLEVDPITLAKSRPGSTYVDDRPYASGSLMAVAIGTVFRTAMNGRCDARPELAQTAIPLSIHLPSVAIQGADDLAERLFGPLGWHVECAPVALDPEFPAWGNSRFVSLRLTGEHRLADALRHLYVMLPVLDDTKHYWVGEEEVAKLVRAGGEWLTTHPEREFVSRRYLAHQRGYVRSALSALDGTIPDEEPRTNRPLAVVRAEAVVAALREVGARRVLDLGCGGGALLERLVADTSFTEIVGTDVSAGALDAAERRLAKLPDRARSRVALRHSSLTYTDPELAGFDAAVLMEVVEHVDPPRLPAVERVVFGVAKPTHVVVTTPNVEYNPLLGEQKSRHPDHRFEWTRAEFQDWANAVAERNDYTVRFGPVGPVDPDLGPATQLAVFSKKEA
ncbi:3' terminal RNA ribose 2'-O-methyltransferase Hen1 [Actinokineospora globicatena]|uniref:3' terminal RNA ribose 2'-O-methyltransferase Hen1 n=1 Tax=Actinokineospora globicatena TaxID=103729 RepID=UPI0020A2B311|nr:3' terminal RNA ribose 2'-O-methyltransferase Hen1 [Actinokineospora globicatena]